MAIKKVVIPENLNPAHFNINNETKTIDILFPAVADASNAVQDLAFNNVSKKITWTQNGQNKEHDMSAFLTDIHVTGASVSAGVLKLESEGQPTITVDLNALMSVTVSNSTTISLSGNGSTDNPLTATLNKSAIFDTELQDAFAKRLGYLSSTNA